MSTDDDAKDDQPTNGDPKPVLDYSSLTPPAPVRLVTISTFHQVWEAHLAAGKIENAGIHVILADEHSAVVGYAPIAMGGIKLQVREEDAEEALEVLNSKVVKEQDEEEDENEETDAKEARRKDTAWAFVLILLLPLAVILLLGLLRILFGG